MNHDFTSCKELCGTPKNVWHRKIHSGILGRHFEFFVVAEAPKNKKMHQIACPVFWGQQKLHFLTWKNLDWDLWKTSKMATSPSSWPMEISEPWCGEISICESFLELVAIFVWVWWNGWYEILMYIIRKCCSSKTCVVCIYIHVLLWFSLSLSFEKKTHQAASRLIHFWLP